ncbi:Golgi-associated plant pathogenesis-related protein 1 [Orchesella cincta]|uniref:Golgi-associated plant pathogenesis-related protein 1 n=1 Tax=Orchesella cincta TaxID=48709 RepID=A0A1D2MGY4_ORCCI|nr:Golgi-associated plant pathogenesis-related protein 1 [Orchesella cincta]
MILKSVVLLSAVIAAFIFLVEAKTLTTKEGQKIQWIPSGDARKNMSQLIPAGEDTNGKINYVARGTLSRHDSRWVPGKAHMNGNVFYMYYAFNGSEFLTQTFELLVVPLESTTWVQGEGQTIPRLAIVGGLEPSNVETSYICRGKVDNLTMTGKLLKSSGKCGIPFHKEQRLDDYEVLVINEFGESIGLSNSELYQRNAVDIHNEFRETHHVGPLTLNDDLNNRAVLCAEYYATKGTIDHRCPYKNGAGENLWASCCSPPTPENAASGASRGWYSEVSRYNYTCNCMSNAGHFTQMVWKNSREFGMGVVTVGRYTAGCALYYPPGNYVGDYLNNVLPP